jgi:Rrf2 family protein
VQMAKTSEKQVRVKDLADSQKCSMHFLEQIFRNLRIAGVVNSVRGPGGGYKLSRNSTEISVKDVLEALGENSSTWGESISETTESKQISEYLTQVESEVRKGFEAKTLAQLAGTNSNVVPFPTQAARTAVA